MSAELGFIGSMKVTSFNGGSRGQCVQFTPMTGVGQLNVTETARLVVMLSEWLKEQTRPKYAETGRVVETVRAHVMTEDEFTKYKHGGTKIAVQVRQEIKDTYKGQGYAWIDVYSPGEELLFRI